MSIAYRIFVGEILEFTDKNFFEFVSFIIEPLALVCKHCEANVNE